MQRSIGKKLVAVWVAVVLLAALGCGSDSSDGGDKAFRFQVAEGENLNYMLREGDTAAHLLLRSGVNPRIVVAFPAGNSGVGAWFEPLGAAAEWELEAEPEAKGDKDSRGRARTGIEFTASIGTPKLTVRQGVLSNVRVLRDYNQKGVAPAEVLVAPVVSGDAITWERDRVDGGPGYRLRIEVMDGAVAGGVISAPADGRIRLRVTASTGDTPLTPLAGDELLNGSEARLEGAKNTLTFLSYREKFVGGSWQYLTYFGRDTLISTMLLMPVLAPEATEAGIRAVLARLGPEGAVAHEESLSEFALLTRQKEGKPASAEPILDYNMVDESYLLAPVTAAYLLDNAEGAKRGTDYLRGENGSALVRNLRLVVSSAAAFAGEPRYQNLIALQAGRDSGQWRDSDIGIGNGRYPYDVNAILVPAALEATARLLDGGLLTPYLTESDRLELSFAAAHAKVWRAEAPRLFTVTLDQQQAQEAMSRYATQIGVPAVPLGADPLVFPAVSLAADGKPIPILHSDDVFELLFGRPDPADLDQQVATLIRPFPLGLMTGAGMVVANPVFADPELQAQFTTHDYHGTVVWSWVQAAFASGLERQLRRPDLPQHTRDILTSAQRTLWTAINTAKSMQNSELWTWRADNNTFHVVPFGARTADVTESNAAQLWSSVYLAIHPPR
ncbi:hypothetical protein [Nocardia sp. XZ_19_385]|uniref:hypothetical protein n=1 Tax=Nocardia sp. XZ_19_385 TaxID=2769488 RepID=UPI00188E000A|nr:hypothetical protein [Nocardia sp. XZ_19_385]